MLSIKRAFGDIGERVAVKYLKNRGYKILNTNFQNTFGRKIGEIDIIARDLSTGDLVFIEVKTRELKKYKDTLPEENITPAKLRKLEKIANLYMLKNDMAEENFRFDGMSIWLDQVKKMAKIKHIPNL